MLPVVKHNHDCLISVGNLDIPPSSTFAHLWTHQTISLNHLIVQKIGENTVWKLFQDLGEEDVLGQEPEINGLAKVDELEGGGQLLEHLLHWPRRLIWQEYQYREGNPQSQDFHWQNTIYYNKDFAGPSSQLTWLGKGMPWSRKLSALMSACKISALCRASTIPSISMVK